MERSDFVRIETPGFVAALIDRLKSFDEEAYIVGGGLRDSLLGKTPSDYDMTTSALPEKMLEIFSDFRVIKTGLKHGTLTVLSDGRPVEITTFRIDGGYTDSRHPDSVSFTRCLSEDLARRDFTVNAMAYSEKTGLVDKFGGIDDLRNGIIRAVGEPHKRFTEDALRIMRAFRFSAQLGFKIEEETLLAAHECRDGLDNIAKERIFSELLKLLHSPHSADALRLMRDNSILRYILGDYCPSERIFPLICKLPDTDEARLGMLLYEADERQRREILSSLKCSNRQRSGAMAVAVGASASLSSRADVSRFLAKYGRDASDALCASVLLGNSDSSVLSLAEGNDAPRAISDLAVGGKDMETLGLCGKEIGEMLSFLLDIAIDEPSKNNKESLLRIAESEKNKIKDRNKNA